MSQDEFDAALSLLKSKLPEIESEDEREIKKKTNSQGGEKLGQVTKDLLENLDLKDRDLTELP
jgi:hypothetical protein